MAENPLANRPNILIILCDDLGYGDLSCMGAEDFVTPHLDALAREGVLMRSFYAGSPVCSPSRAALLTGRYPGRAGVRAILAGHRRASGLLPRVPTLSSTLKREGYLTAAVGKWHLGCCEASRPTRHGFDSFYGFLSGCVDYYSHIFYHGIADGKINPNHDLWQGDEEVYDNGRYLTENITDHAVDVIRKARGSNAPFFLYTAYNAPHYPMHAPKEYMDRFAHLPQDRQLMAAMISAVDDGVGRIVDELKRNGQFENTLIYFQSDNGPSRESRNWTDGRMDPYYGGSAGGLRGYKYSLFEGGIRVPAILCCPALLQGGQVNDEPLCAIDLLPTVCGLLGIPAPEGCDGADLSGHLFRGGPLPERDLFWEMDGQTAVRRGDYKLLLHPVENESREEISEVFLANVREDRGERENLCAAEPERAASMRAAAEKWRADIERVWEAQFADNYRNLT